MATKVERGQEKLDSNIPALSLDVLKLLQENQRLTISEIVKKTGANQNTLKVRLRELVNEQRIKRHGKARATWYSL